MFKHILVASDGSDHSQRAMAAAVQMAKLCDAQIKLLYVFSDPQTQIWPDCYGDWCPFDDDTCQQIKDQIDEFAKRIFERTMENINTVGIAIKKIIKTGYPAARIIEEASKGADLLVMGTCGYSPIEGVLVGSVTQRVMANVECPVLVIK